MQYLAEEEFGPVVPGIFKKFFGGVSFDDLAVQTPFPAIAA